jgi:hypothetical protein
VHESDSKVDLDKYLLICEQLGQEPDPAKMPLELSDFPEEVQVAFFMFSLLPDHWEGMSGSYMGKYWDGIEYYFKLYEVTDPKTIMYIMKMYEGIIVEHKAEQAEQRRKAEERKAKSAGGAGKTYTHNVKG